MKFTEINFKLPMIAKEITRNTIETTKYKHLLQNLPNIPIPKFSQSIF